MQKIRTNYRKIEKNEEKIIGKIREKNTSKKRKEKSPKTYQNTYNTFVLSFRFHNPKVFSGKIT